MRDGVPERFHVGTGNDAAGVEIGNPFDHRATLRFAQAGGLVARRGEQLRCARFEYVNTWAVALALLAHSAPPACARPQSCQCVECWQANAGSRHGDFPSA